MVYVTVAFGVPVKVIVPVEPGHILDVIVEIAAIGKGKIVITTFPDTELVQLGVPLEATLTKLYVVLTNNIDVVKVAIPEAFKTIV